MEIPFSVKLWFYCAALFIAACVFECQYQAVLKYYPRLTRWEFVILMDKIRITPDAD